MRSDERIIIDADADADEMRAYALFIQVRSDNKWNEVEKKNTRVHTSVLSILLFTQQALSVESNFIAFDSATGCVDSNILIVLVCFIHRKLIESSFLAIELRSPTTARVTKRSWINEAFNGFD